MPLDRLMYGRGRWALPVTHLPADSKTGGDSSMEWAAVLTWQPARNPIPGPPVVEVDFDGFPPAQMDAAVRRRIGQKSGVLPFAVWVRRDGSEPRQVLAGALCLDHRSLHRSVQVCAAKLPQLIHAALERFAAGHVAPPVDVPPARPVSTVRLLARQVLGVLGWLMWREQWIIEVRCRMQPGLPPSLVTTLEPDEPAFWADPFLAQIGGRTWLLFEEMPFATMKGHISTIELDAQGRALGGPRPLIREDWHLSYPFVWSDGDRVLLMPEAGARGCLTLYAVGDDGLSDAGRAVHAIMDGIRMADATVIRWNGRLWLFATQADEGAALDDVLCIWHAPSIEGPWRPHRLNPVKVDARSSRPAGAMWIEKGMIHRVAQDCSTSYGGSTVCQRVTRLTPDEFAEERVAEWAGSDLMQGARRHTYNSLGALSVTDKLVRVRRWRATGRRKAAA